MSRPVRAMRCIVAISLSSEECWRLCDAFEPDTQRSLGLSALSASPAPSVTFCPFLCLSLAIMLASARFCFAWNRNTAYVCWFSVYSKYSNNTLSLHQQFGGKGKVKFAFTPALYIPVHPPVMLPGRPTPWSVQPPLSLANHPDVTPSQPAPRP